MSSKWIPTILAVCGISLLINSMVDRGGGGPKPPTRVTQIDLLYQSEADLVIVAVQAGIQKLQNGTLSTDQQARDWLAAAIGEAHRQTWMPVAEEDAKAFADGWTAEKHVERLQEMIGDE